MVFSIFDYILIWTFIFFLWAIFFMWLERMLRLLIGNFIFIPIVLSTRNFFQIVIDFMWSNPPDVFKNPQQIQDFLNTNQWSILIITYLIYIFFVIWSSSIWFWVIESKIKRVLMMLILSPFAVISLFLVFGTIFYWIDFFTIEKLYILLTTFENPILIEVLKYTPVWIFITWYILVFFSLKIRLPKLSFKLNLRKKKVDDSIVDTDLS